VSNDPTIPPVSPDDIEVFRSIVAGTARGTGETFFNDLVANLARATNVRYAFVAEFAGSESRVRTLAYWGNGALRGNIEFDLSGTPCEDVLRGQMCHHPAGVAARFPLDHPLTEMRIESYLGVPLKNAQGKVMGHLAVFDTEKLPAEPRRLFIFEMFAARAAAELERLRFEHMLRASEDRFRDLYDEAPIAYVHEGVDSRFISANRAAMRILGIKPGEVEGTYGASFVPDTPEARKRFDEAFASVGKGTDTSGVVLELRRKDNGKPVYIQWWSKPDPSGTSTRTMFVDITERVLMEQEKNRLAAQNVYLQEEIKSVHNFEEIVGRSPQLLEVIEKVNRVAKTDATVLITGETGTGKELIARAIHSASGRKDKPLIKLNCAALPASLVESELFGHEKGAFSGAISRRIGRFELAQGGTIFLDEIGEVPSDVQVKLLRVLQEREFERVGGSAPIKVDVRVIAATNRDLPQAIKAGNFRADLFYRLNVFPIAMPPLRNRTGDVALLAQFLIGKFAARVGRRIDSIGENTLRRLNAYHWPGNIRELENILERAIILSDSPVLEIEPEVFGPIDDAAADRKLSSEAKSTAAQSSSLQELERSHILSIMRQTNWVIEGSRGAAKILDLHPNTLRSRLKKLGLDRASLDAGSTSHDAS
jgi:PAS domain S-box-containing protein